MKRLTAIALVVASPGCQRENKTEHFEIAAVAACDSLLRQRLLVDNSIETKPRDLTQQGSEVRVHRDYSTKDAQGAQESGTYVCRYDEASKRVISFEMGEPQNAARNIPRRSAGTEAAGGSTERTGDTSDLAYAKAIRCWALTDIVDTLVTADVITDPNIVRFSGRAKGVWQDRALRLGGQKGMSAGAVHTEFDREEFALLGPLRGAPESAATARIEGLVRDTSNCQT